MITTDTICPSSSATSNRLVNEIIETPYTLGESTESGSLLTLSKQHGDVNTDEDEEMCKSDEDEDKQKRRIRSSSQSKNYSLSSDFLFKIELNLKIWLVFSFKSYL